MRIKLLQEILDGKKKVYEVASLLSVSRQSVSKWLARYRIEWEVWVVPKRCWPKNRIPVNRTNRVVEEMVGSLARRYPTLWPRSLAWKFQEETRISLNQSTIYRILSRTWVRYKRKWEWRQRRKTLYILDRPGREIQLDVCFPFWRSRKEVQYDAIDDCSRFVFSRVHSEQCVRSSMEFVLNLIDSSPFRIQTIRTDCGAEFGKWFTDFLTRLWIQHKRNTPYTPQHNGKVERYHRTLWQNLGEYSIRIDIHEYRLKLKLFTDYYNHKKPHSGLGMFGMTPAERIGYSIIQNSLAYARESEDTWEEPWGLKCLLNVNLTLQFNKEFTISSKIRKNKSHNGNYVIYWILSTYTYSALADSLSFPSSSSSSTVVTTTTEMKESFGFFNFARITHWVTREVVLTVESGTRTVWPSRLMRITEASFLSSSVNSDT